MTLAAKAATALAISLTLAGCLPGEMTPASFTAVGAGSERRAADPEPLGTQGDNDNDSGGTGSSEETYNTPGT